MTRQATTLTIALGLLAALGATPAAAQPAAVTGDWNVSLHGQHVIPVGMTLTQDGDRVTGTLMLWNGDVDLTGTFVGGALKVAGTLTPNDGSAGGPRIIDATLAVDGTLAGTIVAAPMGTIKLTAERFKQRPVRGAATPTTAAAPAGPGAPFAGRWTLAIERGTERQTFELTVAPTAAAITGRLASDHTGALDLRDARVEDGALHFAVQMTGTTDTVEFTARVGAAGTLTGTMRPPAPMGEVSFTATRPK